MRTIFLILFMAIISILPANSQELISSAAGEQANSGYHLSWSLGDPFIQTLISDEVILTQGFHQTGLKITDVKVFKDDLNIKVFPNPAKDFITIRSESKKTLHYSLFNLFGEKIREGILKFPEDRLDMTKIRSGTYILMLYDSEKELLQNMKIIKQ